MAAAVIGGQSSAGSDAGFGGTNLKVLEAMAMDGAVVSTSPGCAGLDLEHMVNILDRG